MPFFQSIIVFQMVCSILYSSIRSLNTGLQAGLGKSCFLVNDTFSFNGGYCVYANSKITTSTIVIGNAQYSSVGVAILSVQVMAGKLNIYLRTGTGAVPANGATARINLLVINT